MKTPVVFLAFSLLPVLTTLAQTIPNPNAERDIRLVKEYLTSLTEDQPEFAYTAPGMAYKTNEAFATTGQVPAPHRQLRGFTNPLYHFESEQSVMATGENGGVTWVGLWGTWTATDANHKPVRLPFRHLVRIKEGRIAELHTARGEDGEGSGWWCEPLFGNGPVSLVHP